MDVRQTPPDAQQTTTSGFTRLGTVINQCQAEWEARREQVKRDLEAAIAETQAEITRLEAWLAEHKAQQTAKAGEE